MKQMILLYLQFKNKKIKVSVGFIFFFICSFGFILKNGVVYMYSGFFYFSFF